MQIISDKILIKAKEIIASNKADCLFGWKKGELSYDTEPFLFKNDFDGFVYDSFCAPNLCKYMIKESKNNRILLLLKPCDTRGFQLLTKEHRINRENIYTLGIPCAGKADNEKLRKACGGGIISIDEKDKTFIVTTFDGSKEINKSDVLSDKCKACLGKDHIGCDEVFMTELSENTSVTDRFKEVEEKENLTSEQRFAFWRSQLSKCIRCNACRNVCPACSCVKCVFDNDNSGVASKANADDFEENLFHIIRSFHVCGRCVDCGECSRVCPEHIPLHLLNRKYIKDINELYGEEDEAALLTFTKNDPEPSVIYERDGNNNV